MKPIPLILDTDLGNDIDDSWALAMLLKCPELDLKMVLTDTGDTAYRAKIAAKMLMSAGRGEVALGLGLPFEDKEKFMQEWVEDVDLKAYPGPLYQDGVSALIKMLMDAPEPVTLIAISAVPNIAEALKREPRIASKIKFVGMHGSIYSGYDEKKPPEPEANVRRYPAELDQVFHSLTDILLTPLDTCGRVVLEGERYQLVCQSSDPLLRGLMEQYRLWTKNCSWIKNLDTKQRSSTLFDTVAVYLAYAQDLLEIEELSLKITSEGMTLPDPLGIPVRAALRWKNLDAFYDHLVARLLSEVVAPGTDRNI